MSTTTAKPISGARLLIYKGQWWVFSGGYLGPTSIGLGPSTNLRNAVIALSLAFDRAKIPQGDQRPNSPSRAIATRLRGKHQRHPRRPVRRRIAPWRSYASVSPFAAQDGSSRARGWVNGGGLIACWIGCGLIAGRGYRPQRPSAASAFAGFSAILITAFLFTPVALAMVECP